MKNIIKKILLSEKRRLLYENKINNATIKNPKNENDRAWNNIINLYNNDKIELCKDKKKVFGLESKSLSEILIEEDTKFYDKLPAKLPNDGYGNRENIKILQLEDPTAWFPPEWFKLNGGNRERGCWLWDGLKNDWELYKLSFPSAEDIAKIITFNMPYLMKTEVFTTDEPSYQTSPSTKLEALENRLYSYFNCCSVKYNGKIVSGYIGYEKLTGKKLSSQNDVIAKFISEIHKNRQYNPDTPYQFNRLPLPQKNCPKLPVEFFKLLNLPTVPTVPKDDPTENFVGVINIGNITNTDPYEPSLPKSYFTETDKTFKFKIYSDIVKDLINSISRNYKFKMGEFFRVGKKEKLKLTNFLRAGFDNKIKDITHTIIDALNMYEWDLIIRPEIHHVSYGGTEGRNITIDLNFKVKLKNTMGNSIASFTIKSKVSTSIFFNSDKNKYTFTINPSPTEMEITDKKVTPTGESWIDQLFDPDNISFDNGVIYINRTYTYGDLSLIGSYLTIAMSNLSNLLRLGRLPAFKNKKAFDITIPIDVSKELKLSMDFDLPIPENIPFTINLPSGKKKVNTEMINLDKGLSNRGVYYMSAILFRDNVRQKKSENPPPPPPPKKPPTTKQSTDEPKGEPIIVGKDVDAGIKINESKSTDYLDKNIDVTMSIHKVVIQKLIDYIGPFTIKRRVTQLIPVDKLPDIDFGDGVSSKKWLMDNLDSTLGDISISIGNIVVSKQSSFEELEVEGQLTITLPNLKIDLIPIAKDYKTWLTQGNVGTQDDFNNILFTQKFTGIQITNDPKAGFVSKTINFSGIIKIKTEGRKITCILSSLNFDIGKFFNLSVQGSVGKEWTNNDDNKGIKLTAISTIGKVSFNLSKSPLSFTYEIPKLDGKTATIELGNNVTKVKLNPSNSYKIVTSQNTIIGHTSINMKSYNVDYLKKPLNLPTQLPPQIKRDQPTDPKYIFRNNEFMPNIQTKTPKIPYKK